MIIKITPGTQNEWANWGENPVIAIDLGMSERKRTTGFAYSPDSLFVLKATSFNATIGECTTRVCDLIREKKEHSKVALIIEAPLSFAFDGSGNPTARRPIEVTDQERPWHHQPACGLGLIAVLFLRRILDELQPIKRDVTLHVFEGFISGEITEVGPPAKHRSHLRDAHNLVTAFQDKGHVLVSVTGATGSLLPLVRDSIDNRIPAIIQVSQGNYKFI